MKKNLLSSLFVALLLTASQLVFAQVGFGPRIGVNFPTVAGVNNNAGFKAGLHIGGYARLGLSNSISFQPEVLYSMKGCKYSSGGGGLSLSYIDIPLLLNFGKKMHFQLGAQPSFLLSAKSKIGSSGSKVDVKSNINSFDIAPVLGFGYQAEGGFTFDIRFAYGIPDILKNNPGHSQHNFNAQVTFGYTLGGK